jgi:MoaA/NifB/PqqE/SkfB family radical SAM enzyme
LQVHPTLRCNLSCLHCYSSSGPELRVQLPIELVTSAISAAADEGYTVVSVSGGEPLMYKPLAALLDGAHTSGALTTVTTNGMLLTRRRLDELAERVDLLAISLDGPPESHDRMRGSPHAFRQMHSRLAGLRESGIPFGFIFTLTQRNVHELDWVARFAVDEGARLLQVHPLEEVGRARRLLVGDTPDALESAYAFIEVARLRAAYEGMLTVQLDLVHGASLSRDPARVYAAGYDADAPLSELVSPLVIEASGLVVPLQYGFSRPLALGSLHKASLGELARRWRETKLEAFSAACSRAFSSATAPTDLPFANWYELVANEAALVGAR